jgi:hypothetical protein
MNLTVNGSIKLGNAANDSIGFFNKEPIQQQWANTADELLVAFKRMGLVK